jgi:predicted O-methyltransferase YrrM
MVVQGGADFLGERARAQPLRLVAAAAMTLVADAATRLLPLWRAAAGLARGPRGLRAARRLNGRREAMLSALVARLGWARDALPPTEGWAGSAGLLLTLVDEVEARRPRLVVEFGSGLSTLVLARALALHVPGARLLSFDHDAGFAAITRRRLAALGLAAEVRHAPLADAAGHGVAGEWYDHGPLPHGIELLLIDGPPAWLRQGARAAAGPAAFPHLALGGVVLLDDADRQGERANAAQWARAFPGITWARIGRAKGILRGVRSA